MKPARAVILVLLAFLATSAAAQPWITPGTVFVATSAPDPDTGHDSSWLYGYIAGDQEPWRFGCPGTEFGPCPPIGEATRLTVRSASEWVFVYDGHLAVWDGTFPTTQEGRVPYRSLRLFDYPVSNFVLLPTGRYVVAEQWSLQTPLLFELNTEGVVREIPIPFATHPNDRFEGATVIALRADGCTLLYANADPTSPGAIHQMNACTGAPLDDYAALPRGFAPNSLRELRNGHVLAATDGGLIEVDEHSRVVSLRDTPGAKRLAFSSDGRTIWVAGDDGELYLMQVPLADAGVKPTKIRLGHDPIPPATVTDMAVIAEWQPWARPPRGRAVRH